jgi:hypothetical protein
VYWKHSARNLFRHFECELKTGRRGGEEFAPELVIRELIEGEIAADGRKGFRVLAQAIGFEPLPRKPPRARYRSRE